MRPTKQLAMFLAVLALSGVATIGAWFAGTKAARPAAAPLSYLDAAAGTLASNPVETAKSVAPVVATPARAPRAIGVSNGSYDTRHDGVDFVIGTPAGTPSAFNLRLQPASVTCAGELLSAGAIGEYDVANGGFEAKRGNVAERYMYDANRVEQLFVISTKPDPVGAIEVRSPIAMEPAAKVEVVGFGWNDARFEKGGLRLTDANGAEVAAIYGARVIDADGRQQDLAMGWENGAMTMTVPASFVEIASFPIIVDPWIELAGSGTIGIAALPSGSAESARLARSGSGTPIVAVTGAAGDIEVAAFNSGTGLWSGFGGSVVVAATGDVSTINDLVCPAPLNPIVVWTEAEAGDSEIFLARWNGVAWVELDGSLSVGGLSGTTADSSGAKVALDPSGNPVVAWLEDDGFGVLDVLVRRFDGAAWVDVGAGSGASPGIISAAGGLSSAALDLRIDPLGRPVVAWVEATAPTSIYLRRFDPATDMWEEISGSASAGGLSASLFDCDRPDLAFDAAGEPMVTYQVDEAAADLEIYLKRYDSLAGAWVGMGGSELAGGISANLTSSADPSLAVDASGAPTVAWRDVVAPGSGGIYVRRFNGAAWVELEGSATFPGISAGAPADEPLAPSVSMRSDGYPGVAWVNSTGFAPVLFRQYDGIPVPTAGIAQTQVVSPFAAIAAGGTSATGSVRLTATIPSGIPTTARLQVEVQPTGVGFTGVPNAESTLLPAGTTASIVVPLSAGTYEWQYRVQAADPTIISLFTEFVAGGATDFVIGTIPAAPLALDLSQHHLDTGVAIASGGTTLSGGAIFRYTPSVVAAEPLRLQVDFTGDGVVDVESPLTPPSTTISIPVPLAIASYSWSARLTNAAGVQSPPTDFPLGPPDFSVIAAPPPPVPAVPSLLTQTTTGGTPIASGGVTTEPMIVLGATLTGAPGDLIRLQFDVELVPGLLDGIPDFETPLIAIPGGGSIAVTYTIPAGDGGYNWAVRAESSALAQSGFAPLIGGPPDFVVDTPTAGPPPAAPVIVGQFRLDGLTAIPLAGVTPEGGAIFRVTLPFSPDLLRMQLEVAAAGGPFTGVPDAETPLVIGGTTVEISFPLGAGGWQWRARTFSSASLASAYVEFSPGFAADLTVSGGGALPPAAPVTLAQQNLDGSAIPSTGTALGSTVVFSVAVPGLVTDLNRIQVDVETTGSGLDGIPDVESPLVIGGTTVTMSVPLAPGAYNWQARTVSSVGLFSGFTAFPGGAPDFNVPAAGAPPAAPAVPTALDQLTLAGVPVAAGGTIAGNSVLLRGTVPGVPADLNRLQVEVVPSAGAFTGVPTLESPLVPGGTVVTITASLADNAYMWRARTFSSFDLGSTWVDFAAPAGTDFSLAGAGIAPGVPTALDQQDPGGAPIAPGATAAGDIVIFVGTVTGASGEPVRMQVEYSTGAFSGVPDVESPLVPSGTSVSIAVPLAVGSYDWQARTMNGSGSASGYASLFGGIPDFVIAGGAPPVAPAAPALGTLTQRNLDLSVIATGGLATGNEVVLEATVPGPVALGRIQFELTPAGSGHSGNPDVESVLVPGGTVVQVTVPLAPGGYHWQARTQASTGLSSAFVELAAGTGADFTIAAAPAAPVAPATPLPIDQQTLGGASVPATGTVAGDTIALIGTIPGAPADLVRLQVEVVPAAAAFTGIPTHESSLQAGGTLATILVSRPDGSYKWRARSFSSLNLASLWVDFDVAIGVDFVLSSVGLPPSVPAALDQRNPDGSSIAAGGTATGSVVVFVGTVTGASGEPVRLQVDFAPSGGLSGVPDVESPLVPSGSVVQISVPFANGSYEWQARTINGAGAASLFVGFGGAAPDFNVTSGAPGAAPAAPLAAGMTQRSLDGIAIAPAGTATGNVVIFEVGVPGLATDLNRIQIDVEAGALDGIPDVESALVPGGATVQIAVPFAVGAYDWAARTMSSAGLVSGFTPFDAGTPDFVIVTAPAPAIPGAPVTLDQQNLDGSSIPSGGTALGSQVVFEVVVPGVPADLNRIQIDVEATGLLDGNPDFESPLVPGGSTVHVQGSFGNGSYEWTARTQSSQMADSVPTPFALAGTDFVVALGGPTPPVPAGLSQTNPGGSAIAVGGTTATNIVIFTGTVATTPAGGTARLQVEFSTAGFSGVPDVESPLVTDGSAVSIAVPLGDGSYNWQARTQSSGGAASAYVSFDVATPDFVVAAGAGGAPPGAPTGLIQRRLDGTIILPGGSAAGGSVIFEGIVGGLPGSMGRLQVEYTPVGVGFSGVPDVDSPLVLAGTVVQITVPLTTGTFEWQARTQSSTGATSAFVEFAAGAVIDFTVPAAGTGSAPSDPIALDQRRLDGVTGIASGGTTDENAVTFQATLPGAAIDLNRLLVEYVDSIIGSFSGNPSVESPLVPGGATVSIAVPIADGSYMWRARSQSSTTASSAWVDFGAPAGTDFIVSTGGVAPPAPTGLSQTNPGGSLIGLGATATTDVVVFGATVTAAIPGELVRLQVDFAPVGGLSGTPDVESPLVPSGTLVSIAVPLGDGGYEWQARALAASGAAGVYAPFGGTSGATPDFLVSAGAGGIAPSAPTGLAQRRLDGTLIPGGGTTSGDTVVYEGVVSGPAGSFLRLEVEFALFGTGLAGVPDVESPLVPTGSTVQIEVAHGDGSYEWQARARTSTGAVSGFSAFGGSSGITADFVVAAGSGGVPPAAPTGIGQFQIDGISAIPAGGIVADDKIMFRGTLPGPAALLVRLQVEYVDSAGAFFGNPVVESPLVPGSSTVSISVPIADGSFMWRARSQSSTGASSAWVDFAAPVGTDFTIASAGLTPPVPTGLAQENLSGSPIPSGGTTFSDTVVFRSTVFAPGGVGLVKMQVEFAPTSSLSGIPDAESPLVPSGTSVTLAIPIGDGSYEWQARTVTTTGLASAFVPFGGTTGVTDFIVSAGSGGPTPGIPSGLSQLRLDGSLIPAGGTTSGDTVVFEGLVTGASGSLLRLQVEFSLIGGGFTGIPDVESVLVPTGSTVQIAVPLGDGSYEWQARTQSSLGAVSAFTVFGAPGTDFIVASSVGGTPPAPPSALEQRTIGGALVLSGATVTDDTIVFRGTVPGTSSDLNRMQVEYVILPTVFTGVPSVESPLVPGGSVVSIIVPVADGSYGWQARAQSSLGGSSGYVNFGLPADVDFIIAAAGVAPVAPTGLFQADLSSTPLALAATLFDDTVVLGGTVTTPVPGDSARIQIEIRSLALFSGVPDVESPLVPSGSVVSIAVPLADGAYSWQARTRTSLGAVSPFVEFDPSSPHFIIDGDGGVVPPAPTALAQSELDLTPIPLGGTVFDQNVVFSGTVSSTDGTLVRLQVDYTPITGTPDLETLFLPTGSLASLTIALPDGVYDWSARTVTSKGVASPWTPFSGGTPDFIVDADQSTNPPATPTGLDQLDETLTPVPVGGTVFNDDITFTGVVPGLASDLIRLQVEFANTGVLFTGNVDIDSPLMPGGSTVSILVPFGAGSYHWRARSQRSVGVSSAWVEFGGNPTTLTDFIVVTNPGGPTPPIPTELEQLFTPDNIIPVGELIEEHDLILRGRVSGIPGELLRLQVEVQVIGLPFTGAPNFESALVGPDTLASIYFNLDNGFYHWRARTISSTNATSPWVSFGGNSDGEMDFGLESTGQYDDDDKGGIRHKLKKKCGLIGLEVPALFLLAGLLGRAVRRVRRKSA